MNQMSLNLGIGDCVSILENGEPIVYVIVGIDPSGKYSKDNTIVCNDKKSYLLRQKDTNKTKWIYEDELVNSLRQRF